MKNIAVIKNEIDEILSIDRVLLSEEDGGPKKLKAARKRLKYLEYIKAYLSTNPSEEFVRSEIDRITSLVKAIDDRFVNVGFKTLVAEKKARKEFLKDYGVPKMNEQLKTLRFILK